MFKISEKTKIYIVATTTYFNGGGELLHQLCDVLNRNGREAYMCYLDKKTLTFKYVQLPEHIQKYKIMVTNAIEDNEYNILIVPEKFTEPFRDLINVQKCIWWLGMNQYFWRSELNKYPTLEVIYHWTRYLSGQKTPLPPYKLKGKDIVHLSQCWYGVAFLNKKGFHNVGYLSDYINGMHEDFGKIENREDIVLYNPKRNVKYLNKIINYDKNIKYVPIINMTNEEVSLLMKKAKLYIDMGSHPGKDRMPREAALHGCCILTSTEGSADFWDDVPIESEFKFIRKKKNIPVIHKKILEIFKDYSQIYKRFDFYRSYILTEQEHFESDVKKIFGME